MVFPSAPSKCVVGSYILFAIDEKFQVKPQMGVASYEKFSLSEDGKRLTEELSLGGGEFPSVKLKRVYDHTDRPLPRAVPNNE